MFIETAQGREARSSCRRPLFARRPGASNRACPPLILTSTLVSLASALDFDEQGPKETWAEARL